MLRVSLRVGALAICVVFCGAAPMPTAAPTIYNPTVAEAPQRTLRSGAYGSASGTSRTGAAIDGFALSLTANHYTLRMGEDLWFAVELRNVSGLPMRSSFSSSTAVYDFTARNLRSGNEMTRSAVSGFGPPATYEFPPNTSLYLWPTQQVTPYILEAGTHEIQVTTTSAGRTLRSNVVTLEVLPPRDSTPAFGSSDPSSGAPSGTAVGGAALSLAPPPAPYRAGSPIWIDTEVRNLAPGPIDVMQYMSSLDVKVTDLQTGRTLEPLGKWGDCLDILPSPNWFEIPKGQSRFGALRLNRCFQSMTPGIYSVRVVMSMTTGRFDYTRVGTKTPITLESNSLKIRVLPLRSPVELQSAIYEGPPAETATGPAADGFALALTVGSTGNDLAAPLFATVELRNVSGRVQNAFFGSRRYDYAFEIVNRQTGQVVPRDPNAKVPAEVAPVPWNSRPIYPDTSLYSSFWLSGLYRFTEGGTYTVRVIGRPIIGGRRATLESNSTEAELDEYRSVPYPGHLFSLHLEADKQTYRLHEPIKIRVSITNVAGAPYSILAGWPPAVMLPLVVQDGRGVPIAATSGRVGVARFCSQCGSYPLAPGERVTLGWMEISNFWYALTQPGTYSITTSLHGVGFGRIPHGTEHFGMNGEDRSNPISIQILP